MTSIGNILYSSSRTICFSIWGDMLCGAVPISAGVNILLLVETVQQGRLENQGKNIILVAN
jgi:hypothetical protein